MLQLLPRNGDISSWQELHPLGTEVNTAHLKHISCCATGYSRACSDLLCVRSQAIRLIDCLSYSPPCACLLVGMVEPGCQADALTLADLVMDGHFVSCGAVLNGRT